MIADKTIVPTIVITEIGIIILLIFCNSIQYHPTTAFKFNTCLSLSVAKLRNVNSESYSAPNF